MFFYVVIGDEVELCGEAGWLSKEAVVVPDHLPGRDCGGIPIGSHLSACFLVLFKS